MGPATGYRLRVLSAGTMVEVQPQSVPQGRGGGPDFGRDAASEAKTSGDVLDGDQEKYEDQGKRVAEFLPGPGYPLWIGLTLPTFKT